MIVTRACPTFNLLRPCYLPVGLELGSQTEDQGPVRSGRHGVG